MKKLLLCVTLLLTGMLAVSCTGGGGGHADTTLPDGGGRVTELTARPLLNLFYPQLAGFVQPLGPIMPIAEAQAEWLADLLRGKATLPSPAEMQAEITAYERWLEERFVASKRHTIEVDFHPYLREIRRERKRVAQRA
jgi:hypothetical protein